MVGFAPRAAIDAPPRLPLPFGLFSVLSLAEAATERWENGVTWEAISCLPLDEVLVADCDPAQATGFPKQFPDGPGTGEADPFTVYGTYKCSGPAAVKDAQAKAKDRLLLREEHAAERRLWLTLAGDDPTRLDGGDPLAALARVEQFIGDTYGSLGAIHMNRASATVLAVKGLIAPNGRQMQTKLGTPVVVGTGYGDASVGPGAALTAGQFFIAASPALFGYRSEVMEPTSFPGDLMDRANNDVFGIAERNYLIGYDPCGVAFAPIDLSDTLGG